MQNQENEPPFVNLNPLSRKSGSASGIYIIIDKIYIGIVNCFSQISKRVIGPLIDVRILFLLNILRTN